MFAVAFFYVETYFRPLKNLLLKKLILPAVFMLASPLAAQETCMCLKCIFGQHRLVQATSQNMAPALEPGDCRYASYLNGGFERLQFGDMIFLQHQIL